MTPCIEDRLRAGVQAYLESGNHEPMTVCDFFGPDWTSIPGRTRSTIGAWFLAKVRRDGHPGLRAAGRNDAQHMTYERV